MLGLLSTGQRPLGNSWTTKMGKISAVSKTPQNLFLWKRSRGLLHKTFYRRKLWLNLKTRVSTILPLTLTQEKTQVKNNLSFLRLRVLCNIGPRRSLSTHWGTKNFNFEQISWKSTETSERSWWSLSICWETNMQPLRVHWALIVRSTVLSERPTKIFDAATNGDHCVTKRVHQKCCVCWQIAERYWKLRARWEIPEH